MVAATRSCCFRRDWVGPVDEVGGGLDFVKQICGLFTVRVAEGAPDDLAAESE